MEIHILRELTPILKTNQINSYRTEVVLKVQLRNLISKHHYHSHYLNLISKHHHHSHYLNFQQRVGRVYKYSCSNSANHAPDHDGFVNAAHAVHAPIHAQCAQIRNTQNDMKQKTRSEQRKKQVIKHKQRTFRRVTNAHRPRAKSVP